MSRFAWAICVAATSFLFVTLPAWAQDFQDLPQPSFPVKWQLGLQHPVSPVAERLVSFHNLLMYVITAITIFVLVLLIIVIVKFNEKANPVPAKWSHNTLLEVIWTAVPVLILVAVAVPSYKLLYFMDRTTEAEMTLKVTGNQWYWSYEYPDSELTFDSYPLTPDEIDTSKGMHKGLEVDNHVVLPINTTVRILFTATDVIHAWTIPAFGVKLDNMPGRTNESWTRVTERGRYYGQCSELCGVNHSNMPIVVDVVSKEEFAQWLAAKKQAADAGQAPSSVKLAAQ